MCVQELEGKNDWGQSAMKRSVFVGFAVLLSTAAWAGEVSVTAPLNHSTLTGAVKFVATAVTGCPSGVASMGIYTAPFQLAYVANGSSLNTSLVLSPGTHNTVVQDWDHCGGFAKTPITINGVAGNEVTGTTAADTPRLRSQFMWWPVRAARLPSRRL